MTRRPVHSRRWAMGLWLLLAIVVFNVRFDWQTRMAGHAFVRSQIVRHAARAADVVHQ